MDHGELVGEFHLDLELPISGIAGIVCEELNGGDYRVIPLSDDSPINGVMKVGYIVKKNQILSSVGKLYIEKIQGFLHAAQGGLSN